MESEAKRIPKEKAELEGPYECECGGHFMLDVTFLDQVCDVINCPYCKIALKVPDAAKFSTTIKWGGEGTFTSAYHFDTQAELDAFIHGVNEGAGRLDCEIIEPTTREEGTANAKTI